MSRKGVQSTRTLLSDAVEDWRTREKDDKDQEVDGDVRNFRQVLSQFGKMNRGNRSGYHNRPKKSTEYFSTTTSQKQQTPPDRSILTWKRIVSMESSDILFTLASEKYGFFQLLDQVEETRHSGLIPLLLSALGKAVASPHKANVNHFVNKVQSNRIFMFCILPRFLANLDHSNLDDTRLDSLSRLLDFLNCYQSCMPASSCQIVPILLPHLKIACQKVSQSVLGGAMYSVLLARLNAIKKNYEDCKKNKSQREMRNESRVESLHLQKPPDDFHDIPIFPSYKDIWQNETFLRPNLTKGKYSDVDEYLDVQFRLLREDYIRPLRESIVEYSSTDQGRVDFRKLKVYENVSIVDFEVVFGGIQHTAFFDAKQFKKVNWEQSKRFLTGSLLCLTTDGFQTMLFATVTTRKPQELKKGNLKLKFEELTAEILQIKPTQKFTLMETEAFFEAYRHNLAAFQNLTEDNFPLKKYIVEMETRVTPPPYSISSSLYDVAPLLVSSKSPKAVLSPFKKLIDIYDEKAWPTEKECGMNTSQFLALRAALTKQFAIIQGPPGTGKTYVGLRIMELLLKNSNSTPILIVCYTNHALDQFLEGILQFNKSIVRIGGGSSNEALDEYNLANKKKKMRMDRKVPNHIFRSIQDQINYLEHLQGQLTMMRQRVEESGKNVHWEQTLTDVMLEHHRTSLLFCNFNEDYKVGKSFAIMDWLEVHDADEENEDLQEPNNASNYRGTETTNIHKIFSDRPPTKDDTKDDVYEELFDVDFLEEMRLLDPSEWESIKSSVVRAFEDNEMGFKELKDDDWKILGEKKAQNKLITTRLANTTPMSEKEAKRVRNVWSLDIDDRWRLYKYWAGKYALSLQERILVLEHKFRNEFLKFREIQAAENLLILQNAQIIGMTTTGAAKYRSMVQELAPKIVVVEEAAEILEAHVVTALSRDTEHLILIGDHQQLRPNPTVYELDVKYNLGISLFERMINNGMEYYQLTTQHRMRPCIASLLVPHIYPKLQDHESVHDYEDVKGVQKNMYFINHQFAEEQIGDSSSKVNHHEANFMLRLCGYLLNQGYESSQITILTTYSGQVFTIKAMAKGRFEGVRITTVDNFQGEENDIILVSFVRSNEQGNIGFLKTANRVCVALSRAKKGLYCIGNFKQMASKSKLWSNIMAALLKLEAVGTTLRLICQNHAYSITDVRLPKDFENVPEGGCKRMCEFRLQCGHSCVKQCHPYDPSHEMIKCNKKCVKNICKDDHKCPLLCCEECPQHCIVNVEKVLPVCGHTVSMLCYEFSETFPCPHPCERLLSCGHKCSETCGINCFQSKCRMPVQIRLECGHERTRQCWEFQSPVSSEDEFSNSEQDEDDKMYYNFNEETESDDSIYDFDVTNTDPSEKDDSDSDLSDFSDYVCSYPCAFRLNCGHICEGTCGTCHQGTDHVACIKPCKKILVCGDPCASICGLDCLMSECKVDVNVILKCSHDLTLPCYKSWDDDLYHSCLDSCKVLLQCGHPCQGICGQCRKERLHGKYIDQLPPCNEIVSKLLPSCGHREEMPCHVQTSDFSCTKPCERKLNCGHSCGLKCGETCSDFQCEEIVLVKIKCGHEMPMQCYASSVAGNFFGFCDKPCLMKMACGHICTGTCTACQQGRLHKVCQMKCSRKLLCGHQCEDMCSQPCPPCNKTCERSCVHSKCSHKCGSVCMVCSEPCEWSCVHQKCTNLCGEPCNREPCTESCPKLLGCSHPCLGLCGDPCPDLCNICKPEKINQKQFLDLKIVEDAKFVNLIDCNHIFEVNTITMFVITSHQRDMLSLPSCFVCKTPIRSTPRFANYSKAFWSKVEKAKQRILQKDCAVSKRVSLVERLEQVKDWDNCVFSLTRTVEEDDTLSYEEITRIQNIASLSEVFIDAFPAFYFEFIFQYYYAIGEDCILPTLVLVDLIRLKQSCRQTWNMTSSFFKYDFLESSEQQVEELYREIQRFRYQCRLLDLLFKQQYRMEVDETMEERFEEMVDILCSIGRFRSFEERLLKMHLKEFENALDPSLKMAEVTPKKILPRAMSFDRSNWSCNSNGKIIFIYDL